MLTYFSVDNFKSINSPIELDLRANNYLKKHKNHVRYCGSGTNKTSALRTALIYGANASGKSNVIKAISYAVDLIKNDDNKEHLELFQTFKTRENEPSNFYFEFYVHEFYYRLGFTVRKGKIIKEELHYSLASKSHLLYRREFDEELSEYTFDSSLFSINNTSDDIADEINKNISNPKLNEDIKIFEKYIRDTIEFSTLLRYTPDDELFLSKLIEIYLEGKDFLLNTFVEEACEFFLIKLHLILPEHRMSLFDWSDDEDSLEQRLKYFDSSIEKIKYTDVSIDRFPEKLVKHVIKVLATKKKLNLEYKNNLYTFSYSEDNKLISKVVNTIHNINGRETIFSLGEESDGTVRLLELLPILYFSKQTDLIFIVDELDRSMHPLLARKFISSFLDSDDEKCMSQLIITTHEAELLDNKLVRRDEIFFTQKENDSATRLYSLDDYSERYDKDIQSAYLSGKYGAIPNLLGD